VFGLLFKIKIAAAPFHLWVLDVYEGSPISSTINSDPKFINEQVKKEPRTKNRWSSYFRNSLSVIIESLNSFTFKLYWLYYQTTSSVTTKCILPFIKRLFATSKKDRTIILNSGVLFFIFISNYTSRILITICESNGPITWLVSTFFTTVVPIYARF
jgi:hypothetical protein